MPCYRRFSWLSDSWLSHSCWSRAYEACTRLLVDVASVGFPRDGDTRAAYATLAWDDGWHASIRRVPYDLDRAAAAFRASGMPGCARRIHALCRASYSKKDGASARA